MSRVLNREERIGLSVPVDGERRSRTAAEALNLFLVCVEESVDGAGCPGRSTWYDTVRECGVSVQDAETI